MEEVQWLMEPMDMSVREPARTVAQVGRFKGSERTCALGPRSDETARLPTQACIITPSSMAEVFLQPCQPGFGTM